MLIKPRIAALALLLLGAACAHRPAAFQPLVPAAEHHAHLLSPAAALLRTEAPLPTVELPQELAALLRERGQRWNDKERLAELYAEDSVMLDPDGPAWIRGRDAVAKYVSELFAETHSITPSVYGIDGGAGHVVGYYTRPVDGGTKYFGHVSLAVRKDAAGAWRIASETPVFPGPFTREPIFADRLIAQLDEAGTQKAAVLSVAYWYGSPRRAAIPDEQAKVRAENDWIAAEVARHPTRLAGFCSFNPLRDYALEELEHCAKNPHIRGLKLHFGNSGVDVRKAEHVEKVRRVFRAANERRLALVVHLWTDPAYETEGRAHALPFLEKLLPEAPDVPIQIAHMAGGGRSTDTALAVFADAIAAGDPRTKNLYFDVATLTAGQTAEGLRKDAARMRQIGLRRILYGTDSAPPNPPTGESWATFRARMPLTDEELRIIAGNVAPYFR